MGKNILQQTPDIDITVININAIKVNGKCVVRTGHGGWVRQAAVYTDAEISAMQEVTNRLDKEYNRIK